MEANPPTGRGLALEELYRRRVEEARGRSLRDAGGRDRRRGRLRQELGTDNEALLDWLDELGVIPETVPAFESLPFVEVAWADGHVDAEERWQVLMLGTCFGLELGSPAHAQLELWLERRPSQEVFEAWHVFAERRLRRPGAAAGAQRIVEGARDVAASAGGLLGLGAVSRSERAAIERIRRAAGVPDHIPRRTVQAAAS